MAITLSASSLASLPPKERERLESGMRAPKPVDVPAGATLYRFASSFDRYRRMPIPPARWATGPWWLDEEGFRLIQAEHAASLKAHGNEPFWGVVRARRASHHRSCPEAVVSRLVAAATTHA